MSTARASSLGAHGVAQQNWDRYIRARDAGGHDAWVKRARLCDDYYLGNQWSDADKAKLRAQKRPHLTINQVLSTVNIVLGEQATQRMDLRFKPRNRTPQDQDLSNVLTKLHLAILDACDYDTLEADLFADGIIQDRGYIDVRISQDEHQRGEVKMKLLDNLSVIPDPDGKEYDPKTWKEVFHTPWVSIEDVRQTYGDRKAEEIEQAAISGHFGYDSIRFHGSNRFGDDSNEAGMAPMDIWISGGSEEERKEIRSVRLVERQYYKLSTVYHFVDNRTGDMSRVPETWDDARRAEFALQWGLSIVPRTEKRVRWTVTCDHVVLFDEWSPYSSFTIIPYFPYFRRGRPLGIVANLLDPQDRLNKISSQELHVVNTTANSGWIVEAGALANMTIDELRERGAETGLVLEVQTGKQVDKIQPNQIPTGLDRLALKAQSDIETISGVNSALRGEESAEVSGVALRSKQARGLVQMQVPINNLQRTRKMVAMKVLELVQQFYTEDRIVLITDPRRAPNPMDQQQGPEEVRINEVTPEGRVLNDITQGKYDVVVSAVPSRDTLNDTQFAEALELRQLGIAIPDDRVIEYSNLSEKQELAKEIRQMTGRGDLTPEQQEEQQFIRDMAKKEAMVQLERLSAEVGEIEARTLKLMGEAQQKYGGLDSPEYQHKLRELELQRSSKERELNVRLRLAEMGAINDLDVAGIQAAGRVQVERIRGTTERDKARITASNRKAPASND